jgi:hypothetical protein
MAQERGFGFEGRIPRRPDITHATAQRRGRGGDFGSAIDEAWWIYSPKTAMHDRQRIHSPEMAMLPAVSPFSPMSGPASPEVARGRPRADLAGNDEGDRSQLTRPRARSIIRRRERLAWCERDDLAAA